VNPRKLKVSQRPAPRCVRSQTRELSELDEARLLLEERELELSQTLPKFNQHAPRFALVLKANHEVVAVAHNNDSSARIPLAPLMDPRSSA
jgi:hypothetical protein